MRVYSWNVNGIRSVWKKGFGDWLAGAGADIVGLQEVRAVTAQFLAPLQMPEADGPGEAGYHLAVSSAARAGYSGVGLLSRQAPDRVTTGVIVGAATDGSKEPICPAVGSEK